MSNPIRGTYSAHKSGGYLPGGHWDNGLRYMNIYTEDEQSMLLGTDVDIYPAGEPRYTEKEFAEKLHSMLREIEEAQPDSCAITALIPDMLMVDNEDVPVFGVVQNIHNASDSFDEDKYVMDELPTVAIEKAIEIAPGDTGI